MSVSRLIYYVTNKQRHGWLSGYIVRLVSGAPARSGFIDPVQFPVKVKLGSGSLPWKYGTPNIKS